MLSEKLMVPVVTTPVPHTPEQSLLMSLIKCLLGYSSEMTLSSWDLLSSGNVVGTLNVFCSCQVVVALNYPMHVKQSLFKDKSFHIAAT